MPNQLFLEWTDEDGHKTRSRWWTLGVDPTVLATTDLINAVQAMSEAALTRYGILIEADPATPIAVGTGPYDIADKAVLEFRDTLGNVQKFVWPCPSTAIFAGTSDEIDLDNANVAALVATCIAVLRTRGGEALDNPIRGYRIRTRRS